MEWIRSLNNAIDYIEKHLFTNLSCEDIARQVFSSSYHFQRVFNLLTGMSVGEYIRNRRLSLSGQELTMSDVKVIDIALKYGYSTPESFTKAFRRFHGITPKQAKQEGSNLKFFNRLTIKIKLEGASVMDYRIVKRGEYAVCVKAKMISVEESSQEIPKFWNEYFADNLQEKVNASLGICEQKKGDEDGFRYCIGCECNRDDEIPTGFEKLIIPEHTWAVFKCIGPMPNSIQDMWKRVYSEWLPQAEYEMLPDYDIEVYSSGDNSSKDYVSEIWMPVKRK